MKNAFAGYQKIIVQDIVEFYERSVKTVKRSTVEWRIQKFIEKRIFYRTARGVYSLSKQDINEFIREINRSLKYLSGKVIKQFPFMETCLWSTKWLNEFMLHQPIANLTGICTYIFIVATVTKRPV